MVCLFILYLYLYFVSFCVYCVPYAYSCGGEYLRVPFSKEGLQNLIITPSRSPYLLGQGCGNVHWYSWIKVWYRFWVDPTPPFVCFFVCGLSYIEMYTRPLSRLFLPIPFCLFSEAPLFKIHIRILSGIRVWSGFWGGRGILFFGIFYFCLSAYCMKRMNICVPCLLWAVMFCIMAFWSLNFTGFSTYWIAANLLSCIEVYTALNRTWAWT